MHVYKKRLKAGWNCGKSAKGDGEERQYAKREIKEMIEECDEDFTYRYAKAGRTPNMQARLEHSIVWYEAVIARGDRHSDWFTSYARDALVKAKAKLAKLK